MIFPYIGMLVLKKSSPFQFVISQCLAFGKQENQQ
jgi:hypothetical protein